MLILLFNCENKTKQLNIDNEREEELLIERDKNASLSKELKNINNYFTQIYGLNIDLENQQTTEISDNSQHKRYQAFGSIKNNILDINIPISDKALKIDTCVNISNNKFNVLVIGLSKENDDGTSTNCEVTHLINRKFDVSKLRFNTNLKKLFAITIHTNNFNYKHILEYRKLMHKCLDYQEIKDSLNAHGCDSNKIRPDDDDGDIIP
ncbi:hypothetical protein [Algibacter sp. 2305UL17-15]|uniref:hypothetical protein n=1 Tax=Algibacter sp. 2305UL17-15 TaxID=3231268 RepID=UPI003457E767